MVNAIKTFQMMVNETIEEYKLKKYTEQTQAPLNTNLNTSVHTPTEL